MIERSHSGPIYDGTTFSLIARITFNELMSLDVDLLLVTSWRKEDGHVLQDDMEVVVSNGGGHSSYLVYSPIHTNDSGRVIVTVAVSTQSESLQMYIYPVITTSSEIINVQGQNLMNDYVII